jgi:hypothetical protein
MISLRFGLLWSGLLRFFLTGSLLWTCGSVDVNSVHEI